MHPLISDSVGMLFSELGERPVQLLLALTAAWNGCNYCARAHLLSANLLYFLDGELFPLTEERLAELMRRPDDEIMAELERLLVGSYEDELSLLRRQYELHQGAASDADEARDDLLQLSLACWTIFNEASIAAIDSPAYFPGIGDPLLRDPELLSRYRAARSESTT